MNHYGMELLLDLKGCDLSDLSRQKLTDYFVGLCDLIGMKRHGAPVFWEDHSGIPHLHGTSAIQFIETSNVVAHPLPMLKAVYLNVFSCKVFDVEAAKQFSVEFWQAEIGRIHGGDADVSLNDLYRTSWVPREYLRQYYDTPHVAEDERANIAFAVRHFGRGWRFGRAIEVGCGPTLHHAYLLAPHVDELHLADYLQANLEEVRRSLVGEPGGHNWDVYLAGMLPPWSGPPIDRCKLLRERVSRLVEIDIRQPQSPTYDLVASYYCAECVAGERKLWRKCLAGLASLVAPGGVLLLGVLRRCSEYHVLGRRFPTAFVDEADLAAELPALGFDSAHTYIEPVPVAEWSGQGFDGICCVWAAKRA